MKVSVNVRLLKKVRKLIAEEPRRLRMTGWGVRFKKNETADFDLPLCRTVCCLAGNILLANAGTKRAKDALFLPDGTMREMFGDTHIADRAEKLIGIKNCPFWNFHWKAPEVLAWIDRRIDAAQKEK